MRNLESPAIGGVENPIKLMVNGEEGGSGRYDRLGKRGHAKNILFGGTV